MISIYRYTFKDKSVYLSIYLSIYLSTYLSLQKLRKIKLKVINKIFQIYLCLTWRSM